MLVWFSSILNERQKRLSNKRLLPYETSTRIVRAARPDQALSTSTLASVYPPGLACKNMTSRSIAGSDWIAHQALLRTSCSSWS
ncbi:hypothetical protein H9L39_04627 [Fusarium oxysporum f. sp. albedinis]|nr:hypothetical protein H9L39_04627 [Fusarium oxysporum f. sp. albedinis]